MKLTVLTENLAGGRFLAEHGLSYVIEIDGEKILFDTGHSDVFLKNASSLGIDIHKEVETVVLSHGHWDHGDGLRYLQNKNLVTHLGAFAKRYRKSDLTEIGLQMNETEIEKCFPLTETKQPLQLTKHLYYLGEIPRLNDFESKTTPFQLENGEDDFVPDDSALAAEVNGELIIITGCSHAGICNICEYSKAVTGINKINAVIGGFHLKSQNKQTRETIQYFKKNNVETLLPSHCTELPALAMFYNEFKIQAVKTGMVFQF